jgi:hypothetical protein
MDDLNIFEFIRAVDASGHFDYMSPMDLKLRNCQNKEECRTKYLQSVRPFRLLEQIYIMKLCRIADAICKAEEFHVIPWKFVKVGRDVELGFPHTMGDFIVISDTIFTYPIDEQIEAFIHEKIHVWQRKNRHRFDEHLKNIGYSKIDDGIIDDDMIARNPDGLGTWMLNGKLMTTMYSGRSRMYLNQQYPILNNEHPYEMFAYRKANDILELAGI